VSVSKVSAAIWKPTDSLNLNAATILDIANGWAVGPKGTIARFVNKATFGDPLLTAAPIAHQSWKV